MAYFGTIKVCQILLRYLKVRSHFLDVIFSSLGMHIFNVPNSLQEIRATINHLEAVKNNRNQPKAHRK